MISMALIVIGGLCGAKIRNDVSKKVGNKIYPKYVIVIPEKILKEAGFKQGDKLEAEYKKGEINLRKK